MGDDTPSAVLSKHIPPTEPFLPPELQPSHQPADRLALREYRVMSLKTRFGNLKNVLDEDSSQTDVIVLESPFVGNAQWDQSCCRAFDSDHAGRD